MVGKTWFNVIKLKNESQPQREREADLFAVLASKRETHSVDACVPSPLRIQHQLFYAISNNIFGPKHANEKTDATIFL